MKRISCLLLATVLLCSACLTGCADKNGSTQKDPDAALRDESMPQKLLVSDVTSLPVATDSMSKDELRQLCVDFFRLQLSFQWVPNTDIRFQTTNYKKGTVKELKTDEVYGGIIYQSLGTGSLYRWLEYYDEKTGVFDLETALAENGGYVEGAAVFDVEKDANGNVTYQKYRSLTTLFNQCSASSFWGWGRVINSVCSGWTKDMTAYNGFIPVGCYSYGYDYEGQHYGMTDIKSFGKSTDGNNPKGYDTKDVIFDLNMAKGINAIYECYAQLKPGDLLVDDGHVMMVESVNLYKDKNGTVDHEMSSVNVLEQIEGWGSKGTLGEKKYYIQGGVDRGYLFPSLKESGYIPFTFAEFLDENDPQDKKHLDYYLSYADKLTAVKDQYSAFAFTEDMNGIGVEKAAVFSTAENGDISAEEFGKLTVGSNYTISDAFITIKDADGKTLLTNIYRADHPNIREVPMTAAKSTWEQDSAGNYLTLADGVEALANGENTVDVTLQLSTGEKLTAFTGTLTAN